ncbi:MAG: DUF6503 family protein [Acidobacteriota bacterium]
MKTKRFGSLFAAVALAAAARAAISADRQADAPAGAAVSQAIAYAGGESAWKSKKTVEFRKTVTRFRPDGSVEQKRVETHRYRLMPRLGARIEREDDGKKVIFVNDGYTAWKFVDGKPATEQKDVNSARGSTFGSHYVFGMPFKLRDPGVHLASAGREKLAGGAEVEKIRVTYDKGAGDAGGLHTWTYYFDATTGRLCANLLNYENGKYDFTEYYDDQTVAGVRVATRRRGFGADANGKKGPLTSEILYDQIRFDVPEPDSLFAPPRS